MASIWQTTTAVVECAKSTHNIMLFLNIPLSKLTKKQNYYLSESKVKLLKVMAITFTYCTVELSRTLCVFVLRNVEDLIKRKP